MTTEWRKWILFSVLGAGTAILQLPLFYGLVRMPQALYAIAPGLMFAAPLTVCAILRNRGDKSTVPKTTTYIVALILLAASMPLALAAGAFAFSVADRIFPGDRLHLGEVGISFVLGEIASCVIWSAGLCAWTFFVNKPLAGRIFTTALLLTIVVMLVSNFAELGFKIIWQRSLFLPFISIGEESISGLILAIGITRHGEEGPALAS